jgi:hypothetical protein
MPAALKIDFKKKYGRLRILKEIPTTSKVGRKVECLCDCKTIIVVSFKSLRTGNTQSCGCFRSDYVAAKNRKHGCGVRGNRSQEYGHWKAMRSRCNNKNCAKYERYGGRGITICERWNDFTKFMEDMGPIPSKKHSLDRYPNRNGNYEPGNVRWATSSEQTRNRDCTKRILYEGELVPLVEVAEKHGIHPGRLAWRLKKNWSLEKALTVPVVLGKNHHE